MKHPLKILFIKLYALLGAIRVPDNSSKAAYQSAAVVAVVVWSNLLVLCALLGYHLKQDLGRAGFVLPYLAAAVICMWWLTRSSTLLPLIADYERSPFWKSPVATLLVLTYVVGSLLLLGYVLDQQP